MDGLLRLYCPYVSDDINATDSAEILYHKAIKMKNNYILSEETIEDMMYNVDKLRGDDDVLIDTSLRCIHCGTIQLNDYLYDICVSCNKLHCLSCDHIKRECVTLMDESWYTCHHNPKCLYIECKTCLYCYVCIQHINLNLNLHINLKKIITDYLPQY